MVVVLASASQWLHAQFFSLQLIWENGDAGIAPMGSCDDGLRTMQHEVQRLLGQCLLRLQAYERLMKAIVANHDISGTAQSQDTAQASRSGDIGRKTLGVLVNHLLGSVLTTAEKRTSAELLEAPVADEPAFRTRIQLGLSADDFARVENGLRDLVLLRNNLVHHFLAEHDLGSLDGCKTAETALREASDQITHHFDNLRHIAEEVDRTRLHFAEVVRSDAFRDIVVHGIIPWPITAIVSALQEAAAELAIDGWAPIAKASDWVAARYPEEQPANYGCRTWRQVLHQSGAFELRYVQTHGQRVGWYRVRGNRPPL